MDSKHGEFWPEIQVGHEATKDISGSNRKAFKALIKNCVVSQLLLSTGQGGDDTVWKRGYPGE